jgi:hypothetical protein
MPFEPIAFYQADWNSALNQFRIVVITQNGQQLTLPVNTETEYAAILTMLGRTGVLVDTGPGASAGDIQLPKRPVGS